MKVLLTGVAGFIGSHVAEELLLCGHRVVGLDSFDPFYPRAVKEKNLERVLADPSFAFIGADIRDREALGAVPADIDAIVHLAALAGVRPSIQNPAAYMDVNVVGTGTLLDFARELGVRSFVFASSSSVYGERERGPFNEDDPVDHPISPYAATKKAGELIAHTYHHLFDLDVLCLRFFTVYGPRQRPDLAIHKFARLMDAGRPIPVYGDGSTQRDYTYVDDILDGILAAMELAPGFEIFNLGGAETTALADLVRWLAAELEVEPRIDYLPDQPGDVPITYADVGKAGRLLGYSPKVPIREGLRRFVAWYRERSAATP